ncbi:MAG: acyl-CoA mutase large subunit family protein [SAR324 cluster bacterium]|nr:acyl-CoA mutase large subunit family protein [SAR324 cluster bacterium]
MTREQKTRERWKFVESRETWKKLYEEQIDSNKEIFNRSGIPINPLYTPEDWEEQQYTERLGFPGQFPMTRGIYPSMHRGRTWSQRQLIGLGTPDDYNRRLKQLLNAGASAVSLIPCNSGFRGLDCDEVDSRLLGTCGTITNTIGDMEDCFRNVDIARLSTAMNDPSPFTLLAFLIGVANRRNIPLKNISGTSNQSDYISHFVANHMFFRLSLSGSRRMLLDHIEYCQKNLPYWNPISIVGQHMQQAGATPAEAMAFTLSTAIQYADDCIERGMEPDTFLPRFSFFFDISISIFEEVAKFRSGRRLWAQITRERFNAKDPRSWRFRFHGQTSGVDLTRQQPLNNIARVTAQAIAGIFGGLQSMHTDSYDEVISTPSEEASKIAVATQNILKEEARLCDVIDPLAGSYYVESLTDQMEDKICRTMKHIEDAGGMYKAVESGLVQTMIGESAKAFQEKVDNGEQKIIGVNCFQENQQMEANCSIDRPEPDLIDTHVAKFKRFKKERDQAKVNSALSSLQEAANSETKNVFEKVVDAAHADATHGEIIAVLRQELGFGEPLIVA